MGEGRGGRDKIPERPMERQHNDDWSHDTIASRFQAYARGGRPGPLPYT